MAFADQVEVLDDDPSLEQFIHRLADLDLLVSARLHGIILGLRYGLPFIGIESDQKILRLASHMEINDCVIRDVDFDKDSFYKMAASSISRQEATREYLREQSSYLKTAAMRNCDLLGHTINS